VEHGEVPHEPDLLGQVARDVGGVHVERRDGALRLVVQRRDAEHAVVGAHVGADPVAGEVVGVGVDRVLERLQRLVRGEEARVGDLDVDVDVDVDVVGRVVVVLEGELLPERDGGLLNGGQRRRRREEKGGDEEQREMEGAHCWHGMARQPWPKPMAGGRIKR
jgi:hypothetical protein